jgi:arylsulfatase A-like enzyme
MIRTVRWKYCYRPDDDMDELYDLDSDPYEIHNCIDDVAFLPVIRELRSQLVEWMRSTGDSLPPPATD